MAIGARLHDAYLDRVHRHGCRWRETGLEAHALLDALVVALALDEALTLLRAVFLLRGGCVPALMLYALLDHCLRIIWHGRFILDLLTTDLLFELAG